MGGPFAGHGAACMGWGSVPVLPPTPGKISIVAAVFKRGGYRSYPNYVSTAKRRHIEAGHAWTIDLQLAFKDALRSVARGQGPPRQAAEISVRAVGSAVPRSRG